MGGYPVEVLLPLLFLLGASFGSFFGVVVHRLPRGQSLSGRSRCPHCERQLSAGDLIPVFSYLWLRGRCRYCGTRLSPRYLLVELATGAGFAGLGMLAQGPLQLLSGLLFFSLLLLAAAIDLEHRIIPDILVGIGVIGGLVLSPYGPGFPGSLAGGALLFFVLLAVAVISRGGMGGGDVKLALMMGIFLGPGKGALALFSAVLLAAFVSLLLILSGKAGRKDEIPFGPFLGFGGLMAQVAGERIINWYMRLLS